jgi:hypothetical protein
VWKKCKFNSEKKWKIWKKSKLNSEMIGKIWNKSKLNSDKIWKVWKKNKSYFQYHFTIFFRIFNIFSLFNWVFIRILMSHRSAVTFDTVCFIIFVSCVLSFRWSLRFFFLQNRQ